MEEFSAHPLVEKRDVFDYFEAKKEFDFDIRSVKSLIGFLVYVIIFIIMLPAFLYYGNHLTLLEAYLPNVDMIATVLSFVGGPALIWRDLYVPTPYNLSQFYYQTFCNFIALCGLTYLVSRETKLSNSISRGWSISFVMILITYLLPSQYLSKLLEDLYRYSPSRFASFIAGIGMIGVVVLIEKGILELSRKYLANLAKMLLSI